MRWVMIGTRTCTSSTPSGPCFHQTSSERRAGCSFYLLSTENNGLLSNDNQATNFPGCQSG
jgi:hypothetical protein